MPTPLPYRAGCAAARLSTSTASSPFSRVRGVCQPPGRCPTWDKRVNTKWSCCSTAGDARHHTLPGAAAGACIVGRRVAARGGAVTLPGEGGGVRRRRPTPPHNSPGCREPARCSARRSSGAAFAPCGADRVPARGPGRGLVRPGPRGAGRAVPLADRGLGPRDRGTPQ